MTKSNEVTLWGYVYSVEDTTSLELYDNEQTGPIPPEIGNLTNLERLWLCNNQLTGEIPESICDLNVNWRNSNDFTIYNNQICPPYPSCIENYVEEEDVVSEPRMTREEADEFFRSIGQSLEDKITKGFTEEGAINQASLLKQTMSETPEQSHQRIAINKDHDDIYGK